MRAGRYGQYEVLLVHVPNERGYIVSGTKLIQLIDVSGLCVGDPLRIVYGGIKQLTNDRTMKVFDLYVREVLVHRPAAVDPPPPPADIVKASVQTC